MKCDCGGNTRVLDTRGVHRRRECLKCCMRFSTEEVVVTKPVKFVEKKKRQTKKRVKNILPANNWQQLAKNTSARQRLEAIRDTIKEDDYENY
jgi:transcriptional regulator NrdR family protein